MFLNLLSYGNQKVTPQEIFEYKHTWLRNAHISPIGEWSEYPAKQWCRKNLEQKDWHFISYTAVYEHSIAFRLEEDQKKFEGSFK